MIYQQPQFGPAEIDWGNPLASGLVFAFSTALRGYDPVNRILAPSFGSVTWLAAGFSADGSGGDYIQVKNGPIFGALPSSTVFALSRTSAALGTNTADINGNGNTIYSERGSSGNDIYKLNLHNNAGALYAQAVYRNDSGSLVLFNVSAAGMNDGRLIATAMTKSPTQMRIYCEGLTATDGSPAATFTDATNESRIGDDKGDANAGWNGSIPLVMGWSRTLSLAELNSLHDNPWQLFKSRRTPLRSIGVSIGLPGKASTFSAGSLSPGISVELTGNAGAFSAGTLTPVTGGDVTVGTAGSLSTFANGSLSISISLPLNGQYSAFSQGSLAPSITVQIIGNNSTFASGTTNPSIALSLTGQSGTFTSGAVSVSGGADVTVGLTGNSSVFSNGLLTLESLIGLTGNSALFDVGQFNFGTPGSVGGYYDDKPKKRYVVKVGDQLLVFRDKETALKALPVDEIVAEVITKKAIEKAKGIDKQLTFKPDVQPEQSYDYQDMLDKLRHDAELQNYLHNQNYNAILSLYEQVLTDEEEIELLLMGL